MVYNLGLRHTLSKVAAEDVRLCNHQNLRERRENRKIQAYLADRETDCVKDEPRDRENRPVDGKVLDLEDPESRKASELILAHGLTHVQAAQSFGRSRATITKRKENFRAVATEVLGQGTWNCGSRERSVCGRYSSITRMV